MTSTAKEGLYMITEDNGGDDVTVCNIIWEIYQLICNVSKTLHYLDSRTLVRSGLLSESEFLQFGQQSNSDNSPTNRLMSEFWNQLTCTFNFEISVYFFVLFYISFKGVYKSIPWHVPREFIVWLSGLEKWFEPLGYILTWPQPLKRCWGKRYDSRNLRSDALTR